MGSSVKDMLEYWLVQFAFFIWETQGELAGIKIWDLENCGVFGKCCFPPPKNMFKKFKSYKITVDLTGGGKYWSLIPWFSFHPKISSLMHCSYRDQKMPKFKLNQISNMMGVQKELKLWECTEGWGREENVSQLSDTPYA